MNTESIVTSLEWSKKLKEAGFPQEAWAHYRKNNPTDRDDDAYFFFGFGDEFERPKPQWEFDDWIAAPTAEEILRRLPKKIVQVPKFSYGDPEVLMLTANMTTNDLWYVRYLSSKLQQYGEADESLANAAAAMYCYLAENNLLPPKA
jgi:hypothetical protein